MDSQKELITVVIAQRVQAGREAEYESWIKNITQVASTYLGYMGMNVIRPQPGVRPEYVVVFRFDSYENLKAWMTSRERQYWLAQAKPLVASDPEIQQISGIDAWFSIPGRALTTPPRYKMALLTWAVVYVLINFLNTFVTPLLKPLPLPIASAIVCGIMVVLLTYIVMPQVTRLFRRWLY
ncbi:MAG: antibiotic biosynthesis monooxygenase [Oscillatoria sp. SIO1A7]|nr:antibiotic biosynthesis monooxygenase [Oscillatoria sp. SIO1A7]